MNHAQKHHYGIDTPLGRPKSNQTVRPIRRICELDGKGQRRKRTQKRSVEVGSNFGTPNAFLRSSFLPKLKTVLAESVLSNAESDFYQSLSLVCEHYKVVPCESKHLSFPFNISMAMKDIESKIKKVVPNFEGVQLVVEKGKSYLEARERLDTGQTLYYIPVVPLFEMLKDPERKRAACLLLSVFTYLYLVADVPHYRDETSFLAYNYDMLVESAEDDEPEDADTKIQDFDTAIRVGDLMEREMCNRQNLKCFKRRLDLFTAKDDFDQQCYGLALKIFDLYQEYPTDTIAQNACSRLKKDDDDFDEPILEMDKYVSFIADKWGFLGETLCETIGSDMGEYMDMEEPTLQKHFDGSIVEMGSFDFEKRVFELINELVGILDDYTFES